MRVFFSKVNRKGQVTIPKVVRDSRGIEPGVIVTFITEDDGSVGLIIPRYRTVASLAGAAGALTEPRTWDEMRRIAREDREARWEYLTGAADE